MKKILLLALLIVMGATLSTTEAKKKKDKKQKATPVALQSVEDSLCYATGIQMTNGLIPFLIGQKGVDTTYLYKFIEGFEAAMAKENNADELTAYAAGIDVAKMMTTSMLSSAKRNLSGMVGRRRELPQGEWPTARRSDTAQRTAIQGVAPRHGCRGWS